MRTLTAREKTIMRKACIKAEAGLLVWQQCIKPMKSKAKTIEVNSKYFAVLFALRQSKAFCPSRGQNTKKLLSWPFDISRWVLCICLALHSFSLGEICHIQKRDRNFLESRSGKLQGQGRKNRASSSHILAATPLCAPGVQVCSLNLRNSCPQISPFPEVIQECSHFALKKTLPKLLNKVGSFITEESGLS